MTFKPIRPNIYGDRAVAPRTWNLLPTKLKVMRSSTTTFKHHLKSF